MCHWIGDSFWAMQVIPEIKRNFPDAELWAGIKIWSEDLLHDLIDTDKILILNNIISDRHREKFFFPNYIKELRVVRNHNFDIVLDLTCNRYSALFLWFTRIRNRVGLDLHKLSFLYTLKGTSFPNDRHLSQRPWETIKLLLNDVVIPEYLFPPGSSVQKDELEKQLGFSLDSKIALLAPGAGWKDKEWGLDNFAECGNFLIRNGYKVIISGSEKERSLCTELNIKLAGKAYIFIRELRAFIALLPCLSLAITNESGTGHIIAANNIFTFSILLDKGRNIGNPIGENAISLNKDEATTENVINLIKELDGKRLNNDGRISFNHEFHE